MGLAKTKIRELVSVVDERNNLGIKDFYGINIHKEFMPTVANTDGLNETQYKIVRKNRFVYSGMQTGRDECIRLSMYTEEKPIIVSPAYITFEVTATHKILPLYFFMLFLSKEKDRLGWFYSDSSIRANLDWDVFCDIELVLPPISIQEKYVDIFCTMLANQRNYECGLDDLKQSIDSTIDQYKHVSAKRKVGELLEETDVRNDRGVYKSAQGINIAKQFMPSVASSDDLKRYKIVTKGQFAYSAMQTGRDECIRIALLQDETPIIVSPAYSVLQVKTPDVLPEYIMMWFSRRESDRMGWFLSDSSIRSNLDLPRFFEIEIPVPALSEQNALVNLYRAWTMRRSIGERLKAQIRDLCPILIKGSICE